MKHEQTARCPDLLSSVLVLFRAQQYYFLCTEFHRQRQNVCLASPTDPELFGQCWIPTCNPLPFIPGLLSTNSLVLKLSCQSSALQAAATLPPPPQEQPRYISTCPVLFGGQNALWAKAVTWIKHRDNKNHRCLLTAQGCYALGNLNYCRKEKNP